MSRRMFPVIALAGLLWAGPAPARGLLVPEDRSVPPLALVRHKVDVQIDEQVAITKVEQTFRNHTDRQLEASFVFPAPRGASVNKFSMWVNGKEVSGELLDAQKASKVYTEIVRRTQDPGLLEYLGNDLFRLRVFPIAPKSDQKVALSYTGIAGRDFGVVEYVYPMKSDNKAPRTLEEFAVNVVVKSKHPLSGLYSPTHEIKTERPTEHEARVSFSRSQAELDKDFQLFYSVADRDIGVTALTHRPVSGETGHALFLVAPPSEAGKSKVVPRDVVFVLDTSGSMAGVKMEQGKKAVRHCIGQLAAHDRFTVLNFSTAVNSYRDKLVEANAEYVEDARRWVENLRSSGGTAINDALMAALDLRGKDDTRPFTVVFFTDGQPTVGERRPERIAKAVSDRNTSGTRVFTFGVGDDVNATMLDRLADESRAVSTYVRPAEDIESKAAALYAKISSPVLTDLKLSVEGSVRLEEMYPPRLPDLFQGGQVVVLARYTGEGPAALRLTGRAGGETREFRSDYTFAPRTAADREFVEHLWARRKVGYLLDQVRANGESKELVDEVTTLAKKYGIATPYTSYLIVPDSAAVASAPAGGQPTSGYFPAPAGPGAGGFAGVPPALQAPMKAGAQGGVAAQGQPRQLKVTEFARQNIDSAGKAGETRAKLDDQLAKDMRGVVPGNAPAAAAGRPGEPASSSLNKEHQRLEQVYRESTRQRLSLDEAKKMLGAKQLGRVQTGQLGVDLSVASNELRSQDRLSVANAVRNVNGRNCIDVGGVWIDDGYEASMTVVAVKAHSPAYFRLLERHPSLKDVFRMGNHLVWVTPSKQALVIDSNDGKEELTDAEIDALFAAKK